MPSFIVGLDRCHESLLTNCFKKHLSITSIPGEPKWLFRTSGGMKFKKKQCVTIYFANTLILER
jgi:hypothetical protein